MNQSIKNSKHVVFSWGKKQDLEIINLNPMLQKQCMATSFAGRIMPVTLYNVSFSSRLSECGVSVCHSLCSHTEACSLCTVTVF